MPSSSQILTQTGTIPALGAGEQSTVTLQLRDMNGEALPPTQAWAGQGCEAIISGNDLIVRNLSGNDLTNVDFRATHQHSVERPEFEGAIDPGQIGAPAPIPAVDGNGITGSGRVTAAATTNLGGPGAAANYDLIAGEGGLFDAGAFTVDPVGNTITLAQPGDYVVMAKGTVSTGNVNDKTITLNDVGGVQDTNTITNPAAAAAQLGFSLLYSLSLTAAQIAAGILNVLSIRGESAVGAEGAMNEVEIAIIKTA